MSNFECPPEQWDEYAEEYAKITGPRGPFQSRLISLASSQRPFSTATAILDDGCGTGGVTADLIANHEADLPAGVRLIASDYSSGMIAYLEKRKQFPENASNTFWQRLETHVLDAKDLSPAIPDGSLSHIISNLVFTAIDDAPKPISAAYRALEKGGVLAFTGLTSCDWITIWEHAKEMAAPNAHWDLEVSEPWRSEENIQKMMKDAGFTVVDLQDMVLPMKHTRDSLRGWLHGFIGGGNPLGVNVFGHPSPGDLDKIVDLIVAGVVKEQGPESIQLNGRIQFVIAQK
jgi:ubiquinone/menaquinone biosynthesis C-methylase UbiE